MEATTVSKREKEAFISLIICWALIDQHPPAAGGKPGPAQGQVPPKEAGTRVLQCLMGQVGSMGPVFGFAAGAGDGAALLTACPVRDPGAALRDRKAIASQPPREGKLLLCIWRG